jgi:hypothetical protein
MLYLKSKVTVHRERGGASLDWAVLLLLAKELQISSRCLDDLTLQWFNGRHPLLPAFLVLFFSSFSSSSLVTSSTYFAVACSPTFLHSSDTPLDSLRTPPTT